MWKALSNLIKQFPALIDGLPDRARPAATAALIVCAALVLVSPIVLPLIALLPDGGWMKNIIIVFVVMLRGFIAVFFFLVLVAVIYQFVRGN